MRSWVRFNWVGLDLGMGERWRRVGHVIADNCLLSFFMMSQWRNPLSLLGTEDSYFAYDNHIFVRLSNRKKLPFFLIDILPFLSLLRLFLLRATLSALWPTSTIDREARAAVLSIYLYDNDEKNRKDINCKNVINILIIKLIKKIIINKLSIIF